MFGDHEPRELIGDDARLYWLGVIYDELAGEISAATATNELSQARFQYVLKDEPASANRSDIRWCNHSAGHNVKK